HQTDGDDLRIREGRRGIGRAAPTGQPGMGFEEVINKAIDFRHLVYNGRQMARPPSVRLGVATPFYTLSELWRPSLSTQYSGLVTVGSHLPTISATSISMPSAMMRSSRCTQDV